MTREEVIEKLTLIARAIFENQELVLTDDMSADNVATWTSLAFMQFLTEIENKFGFKFKMMELFNLKTMGNIIDCYFYGLIWPQTVTAGAPFAFMFGQVVDMLYFPLFDYTLPWSDQVHTFFGAVFNFADSCVTCGALYLLIFQYKFFAKESDKQEIPARK